MVFGRRSGEATRWEREESVDLGRRWSRHSLCTEIERFIKYHSGCLKDSRQLEFRNHVTSRGLRSR